tara:strand:- start:365 stop:1627 length:1263 start_codon:yes stop_codon:yes gene_type:complete
MNTIKIAIIGIGYVGLPLALEFGKIFKTIGFDKNKNRIKNLNRYLDDNKEFSPNEIKKSKKLKFTINQSDIKNCNIYIITVPTPIYKNKKPDLRNLINATKFTASLLKKNDIIIYESTVYPGVTDEKCIPILESISKLKCNKDFYCGYSPERINPGDKKNQLKNISKIVSGSNKIALDKIFYLYSKIINKKIVKVSSIRIAEAAKIIENTQRDINIAFMNELTQIFNAMNLNTEEILKAASSKWNFINFKPGFVGGHCISVDPYYLSYKSKQIGIEPKMILSGRKINDEMHKYVFKKLKHNLSGKNISNLNVLILGYTFKENCSDYRNTKIRDLYKLLENNFKKVEVFDPLIINKNIYKEKINFIKQLYKQKYDIILVAVAHDRFKNIGITKIKSFLKNKDSILFDLKYLFNEEETSIRL